MPFQQTLRQGAAGEEGATLGFSQASPAYLRSWPDAVAFREAVQQPGVVFEEQFLRAAEVSVNRQGLPVAYAGRFAVVFRLSDPSGSRWAVRCFTSGTGGEERRARYFLIARHIEELGDIVVPFRYIDRGVCVGGLWYPVLAMPWVNAEPLGRFVEQNLRQPEALRRLAGVLTDLLNRLEAAGIAHGDWQHDNLLVSAGGKHVTVVDYDGMYVPEFAGRWSPEAGHPNYQHPARGAENFGPNQDRFSCLVIQTALLALAHDPDLWGRFSDGESLLFKRADFLNPAASPLFQTLRTLAERSQDQTLADCIAALDDACRAPVAATLPPVVAPVEGVAPRALTTALRETAGTSSAAAAPVPWYVTGAGGAKWWQEENVVLGEAGRAARAAVSAREVFAYIERLSEPETLDEERRNLWRARVVVPMALSLIALSLYWIFNRAHFFPFYVFFWMFNLGNIGYTRWPRRRVYDELNAEIEKMQRLIEKRQQSLLNRRAALGVSGNLADFVADRLRRQNIAGLQSPPARISLETLRSLRRAGIDNALHLKGRTSIPDVSSAEMEAIRRWVEDHELAATQEFRLNGGSAANATNEMSRLQQEIAAFERQVEQYRREKAAFPDCSFKAYLKRLAGIDRGGGASAAAPAAP